MAARMRLQSLVGHSMLYRLANRVAIASRMTSTSVHRLVSSKGANISIARLHTCLLTPLQRPAWKQTSTKYASIFSNRAVSYQNPVCAVQLPSSDEDLPEPGDREILHAHVLPRSNEASPFSVLSGLNAAVILRQDESSNEILLCTSRSFKHDHGPCMGSSTVFVLLFLTRTKTVEAPRRNNTLQN